MPSEKWSTKYQIAGYGGLHYTKNLIIPYFPKDIKRFIEPFGGLGRITELTKAEEYFINDKSEYAYNILKQKFPDYTVENIDFEDFINKHVTKDSFVFCDPPWRKNIYKNHDKPAFTETNIISYYDKLLKLLPELDCKWMITSDRAETENGKRLQKSGYKNVTLEAADGSPRFYNRLPAVRLCFNYE